MSLEVAVLRESGEIALVPISKNVLDKARSLPDEPERYFLIDRNTTMLDTALLVQTRARHDGIESAVNLMRLAYEGKQERRKPICVERWKGDRYLVRDGNSTLTVARAAGWARIPCLIVSSGL